MREQLYYRLMDVESNNLCDETVPILVNCVGYASLNQPFRTTASRRDYYIQFMDKGRLAMKTGGGEEAFLPGQFILHEAEEIYEYALNDGEMSYYWAHFTGSYAARLVEKNGLQFGKIYSTAEGSGHPKRIFTSLYQEFMLRDTGFEDSCSALLVGLIVELARMVGRDAAALTPAQKSRFEQSLSYIHKNYTTNLRIAQLAAMEHLSVSRYRDVFRLITGMAPGEYIISLRIQRACELLINTDYTVTQISSLCGYSDVLYFIRLFREKMGIPPGMYREQ